MKKNDIIFDGKIDEVRVNDLDRTKGFSIEAWASMSKRDSLGIIGIDWYIWKLPYWYPADEKYHWNMMVIEGKKETRYFDVLKVCKENWAEILDIVFQSIKTWNKPAQYTFASAIWRK